MAAVGKIKVLNLNKEFGIVKLEKGTEFKFLFSDFPKGQSNKLRIGIEIEFDIKEPGIAHNCRIIKDKKLFFNQNHKKENYKSNNFNKEYNDKTKDYKYIVPNEIYYSKDVNVKGWETYEVGKWYIHASGRGNPDDVKEQLKEKTALLKANAVVGVTYHKTTGSESGTGNGTHYFTIHNFVGYPVNICKQNPNGKPIHKLITNINENAEYLKNKYNEEYERNKKKTLFYIAVICFIILMTWFSNWEWKFFGCFFEAIIAWAIFSNLKNHGWWLQKYD